ncbi:MAG: putative metal-dependent hydrolase [Bacteroidetes bacterium]|nr:putative metal-dependent hydrolase [Bacteroidota bacterium]
MSLTDPLRYPIGAPELPEDISDLERNNCIDKIAFTPALLREALDGLNDAQLDTPYRPDGWTIRQLVHHIADSHLNAYVRFKWALTEDFPEIKTYDQDAWANLKDDYDAPVEVSLQLIDALHTRWCRLLRSMDENDWKRKVLHPEDGERSCQAFLMIYAWHGLHHIAHISNLRKRTGW